MIRINLLPFRLARKKENIRKQISIFFLIVFFVVVSLVWYTQKVNHQITTVKSRTASVKSQIEKYKEKADRVVQIQKDLKELDEKLAIIENLKKRKGAQLRLFDGMTGLVVPERLWLNSLESKGNDVLIKGVAFDNQTIAQFMEQLQQSPLFFQVDLKTVKMTKFQEDILLAAFELSCLKEKPEQKEPAGKKGKKGKNGKRK